MAPLVHPRLAAAWCILMALALTGVQLFGGTRMPPFFFVLFTAIWLFGAAMLWTLPKFGAWGTAAYGVILGADIVAMHGAGVIEISLAAGSFVGAILALATLGGRA